MRVPATPSLDSRVPLCTAAAPLWGWRRRSAAFWRGALPLGQCVCIALRSAVSLLTSRRILAPLWAAAAAAWQPPAAKEGQGDCDFPLGPPWILLYPLKRRRSARGWRRRSDAFLTRRSAAGAKGMHVALRSCAALWHLGLRHDVLSADWADSYAMRYPALFSAGTSCAVVWPQCGQNCHSSRSGSPHWGHARLSRRPHMGQTR